MKHRIRAAAIIEKDNKLLLVLHRDPDTGQEWWVPPGGGIEQEDSSIYDCIIRETYEETGYNVIIDGKIKYIREFYQPENNKLHMEIFVPCKIKSGSLTIINIQGNGPDEHFIKDVKWISKDEMKGLIIYPEILKTSYWNKSSDLEYLGRQIESKAENGA